MPRVNYMGRKMEADDVRVISSQEHWNTYQLEDGHEVRVKLVVSQMLRVPGKVDPEGNPVYLIRHTQSVVVAAPDVKIVDLKDGDFRFTDLDENVERQLARILKPRQPEGD